MLIVTSRFIRVIEDFAQTEYNKIRIRRTE